MNLVFMLTLLLSTMMAMSANNWIMLWMGMEINLMSFIPMISSQKNLKSSQACMIYFLTQSISSIMFMFNLLFMNLIFIIPWTDEINYYLMVFSAFIKIGMAPFHNWMPEIMSNLNWINCLILMTWQKIAPLMILYSLNLNKSIFHFMIILSAIIGAIGGINLTSLKKMMAYSSINHMSWIVMTLSIYSQWYKYFIIYLITVMPLILMFNFNNINFINQMMNNSYSLSSKISLSSLMLSMGGLPPFLGFIPKWIAIQVMVNSNMIIMTIIMVLSSILTLFYYLRIINSLLMMYSYIPKWTINLKLWNYLNTVIVMINLLLPSFTIMIFY